jgi:predicted metallo-beta-lactamase superfamily hydrolase
MNDHWNEIKKYAKKAEVLIVTHFHYDHHDPSEPEIYEEKILLMKNPREKINLSQRERAKFFLEMLSDLPQKIEYCDGREFKFGETQIKFSQPVPHGTNAKLGYVIEVCIVDEGEKFIHTSDVEGASLDEQTSFLIEENPNIIFLDGPMTYMLGYRYSRASLQASINNILKVMEKTSVEQIVFDHHFLRDLNWREHILDLFKVAAQRGIKILTAAEFAGLKNELLEARRRELYREYPEE